MRAGSQASLPLTLDPLKLRANVLACAPIGAATAIIMATPAHLLTRIRTSPPCPKVTREKPVRGNDRRQDSLADADLG